MNGLKQRLTVDRRGRLLRLGVLIAAALMLLPAAFATTARAAEPNPTIVLIHGAFAGMSPSASTGDRSVGRRTARTARKNTGSSSRASTRASSTASRSNGSGKTDSNNDG